MLEKEIDPKDEGTPAPTGTDQPDENGSAKPEGEAEEMVTLSKKELETLRKKATDFESSVILKGLLKNQPKEEGQPTAEDDRIAKLEKNQEALATKIFNKNLTSAYKRFVAENPWMNNDDKFNKIKDSFNADVLEDEDELLSKLVLVTRQVFPAEYESHLEERLKSKIMSEKSKTDNGGGGAGSSEPIYNAENKLKTDEDRMKEKMSSLFKKNIPSRR